MFGIQIPFTTTAVVMAQLFVAAPFFVNTARSGLEQLGGRYETAAYTLRASRLQAFRHVVLPLTSPALLTAVGLAWARALGEFGATITFAGNFPGVTQTLPISVYIASQSNFDKSIAVSVILLAMSFAVLTMLGLMRSGSRGSGRSDDGAVEVLRRRSTMTLGSFHRRSSLRVRDRRDDRAPRRERLRQEHRPELLAGLLKPDDGLFLLDGDLRRHGRDVQRPGRGAAGRLRVPGLRALPASLGV